jgi:DNA-binding CsgD family transcriptional regulator
VTTRQVPDGCPLTRREFDVLHLACDGLTDTAIAARLALNPSTVTTLMGRIRGKLDCRYRTQTVALMMRRGWYGWQPAEDPSPLAVHHPLAAAVNAALDLWAAGGFTDQRIRDVMHHAAQGACIAANVTPEKRVHCHDEPIRDLLHHVAADTLTPSTRGGRHG